MYVKSKKENVKIVSGCGVVIKWGVFVVLMSVRVKVCLKLV